MDTISSSIPIGPMTGPQLKIGGTVLADALGHSLRPRPGLTVSQWADRHRILSPKAAAEPGRWKTSRNPALKEIMDALSERSMVREVVFMASTQVGKSEVGLNWIGYVLQHAPAPMLAVVPTIQVRKRWKAQRLEPLLTDTPHVAALVSTGAKRDGKSTEEIIDFPGGLLVMGGANSPASLASMPIRYVIEEEVDRYKWDVGGEGDPSGLVAERQKTFRRRKRYQNSTPTMEGASRIEERYLLSDQRRYQVPCPHCADPILLEWEHLRWNKQLSAAWYVCTACGCEIQEHAKPAMLADGRWVATNPGSDIRGYHLNALYAPLGLGDTWLELAREYLRVKDDPVKHKRFVNTKLGRTWKDAAKDIKPNQLMERAESYHLRSVPDGCLLLTAGVDTQDNRLAMQIVGWGRREACWIIDWLEIPGDPAYPQVWERLTAVLRKPLINSAGNALSVRATAIDSAGHRTQDVYNFVRETRLPRVLACKSHNTPNRAVLASRPSPQEFNWRGRSLRNGVDLWMIGSDTAKHRLYARLAGDAQHADAPDKRLVHFPCDLDPEYYDQLTAEVFDPERNRWIIRRGRRNEGIDTWALASAAAHHPDIRVHAMRQRDWDRLEAVLMTRAETDENDKPAKAAGAPEQKKKSKIGYGGRGLL